jgi:2-polyprenyl-3-methyl-5-hydroxy-6-metoxy-1,4-benzoquinol methylase
MICVICGSNEQKLLFEIAKTHLSIDAVYKLYECQACKHWHAHGPLNQDILDKIYGDEFHNSSQQSVSADGAKKNNSSNSPVVLNAKQRIEELKKLKKSGTLLDIGAGRGYFVQAAAHSFQADGIELSPTAVYYASKDGINLIAGDFLSYRFEDKKYDVITLWDVLSCFQDPNPILSKCWDELNNNGLLVMTLPYSSSIPAKVLGKYWPLMIPPINFSYFSEKSLNYLLKGHAFLLLKSVCEAKKVSMDFILRKLLRTVGLGRVENILPSWFRHINISINLGDIITVYAQKQG